MPAAEIHPGIDEFDCGSWLDGSLAEHDVIGRSGDVLVLDGAPSFRTEGLGWQLAGSPDDPAVFATYCQRHAFERAASFGYDGPSEVRIAFNSPHPVEAEQVMLLRVEGIVVSVVTYSYGRAYFEPGDPRTDPCSICGVETLLSAA